MDTQGMFDNETTMTLTAQIFGLSTLVSSFQVINCTSTTLFSPPNHLFPLKIYNVDKRIQEDNLQHLALFSEYGRMALAPQQEGGEYHVPSPRPAADIIEEASAASEEVTPEVSSEEEGESSGETSEASEKVDVTPVITTKPASVPILQLPQTKSPFQRLQFLVRDWQNFDTEYDEEEAEKTYGLLCDEMEAYLKEVLRSRDQGDLQSTREQITRCFETLDCYMLPHPGTLFILFPCCISLFVGFLNCS
jgi:atlastin